MISEAPQSGGRESESKDPLEARGCERIRLLPTGKLRTYPIARRWLITRLFNADVGGETTLMRTRYWPKGSNMARFSNQDSE